MSEDKEKRLSEIIDEINSKTGKNYDNDVRYPDKYYIYKLSEVKAVSSELESDYRFKKGAYADNIRNFVAFYDEICAELQQDDEL